MTRLDTTVWRKHAISEIERDCLQFGPHWVSQEQAIQEYRKRELSSRELFEALGVHKRYHAATVLFELGY